MDEHELRELVHEVAVRVLQGQAEASAPGPDAPPATTAPTPTAAAASAPPAARASGPKDPLAARVALWTGKPLAAPGTVQEFRPAGDRAFYLSRTPARLGVGRTGTRYRTATLLSFLQDHAKARDAVRSAVEPELLAKLGLVPLRSAARDRTEFLLRPDLGRKLLPESVEVVRARGRRSCQVQIVVADGLSAAAIRAGLPTLLPVLLAELQRASVAVGPVFFVANGRMAAGDQVGREVDAEVLCTIVGERPGLVTAESLGAYVTYLKVPAIHEALRSMISNIHGGGLPPEEGARRIAELCARTLRERRSGVDQGR